MPSSKYDRFPRRPVPVGVLVLVALAASVPFAAPVGDPAPRSAAIQPSAALPQLARARPLFSTHGDAQRPELPFRDTAAAAETVGPALVLDGEQSTRIGELHDPTLLRRLRATALGKESAERVAALGRRPASVDKDLPWTADQLLANPTNMNDEHLAVAENPATGSLFAVFAATDLGGTDRDIHVAHSTDDGATWTVREMPASSLDEYHPDIAIDGAGYVHVVWVRADGALMRARSSAPDNPANWTNVFSFLVGEPLAVPSLAVSGSGDFAKLFIAVDWQTINYDYMAYEWTILFLHSTNGGLSLNYDYFLPDGYEDLWPVVTMDGGTVHMINAEVDLYTGETEILIATDTYDGGFAEPALLTGWTENNCGFPDITSRDSDVFLVYQHDYSDGLTTDGDIIYNYSWDGGQTFFGPIGLVADEYESVGPTIFTRGPLVACLWLDAPAGGDEFVLAGRLGSGYGHTDFMGGVETISDQPTVQPMYRSCAGVAADDLLHAVWIDRRDYPTQGDNVYTSRRTPTPNLAPYAPQDWSAALTASMVPGERQDGFLAAGQPAYVSFALQNDGLVGTDATFRVQLRLDGAVVGLWDVNGLDSGTYVAVEDFEVTTGAGPHTLRMEIDPTGAVAEDDETDNAFSRALTWIDGDPQLRLNPTHLVETIIPETSKSSLQELVDNPVLRRETGGPYLGRQLARELDTTPSDGMLRVMIVPAERLDPAGCAAALRGAAPATRREILLAAARTQSDRTWTGLQPALERLSRTGALQDARPLWLAGTVAATLTPAAVEELAFDPAVGRLWLDDQLSRSFGAPVARMSRGAGSPAADPSMAVAKSVTNAWHLPLIGAPTAWAAGATGSGVLVGHLDTGIAYDHPDLAGHLWDGGAAFPHHGYDAVDEDGDPYDGDTSFHHGTHTAGLIVGDGTSGTATGAAPGATLMALRSVPGYVEDMNQAIQFGLDHGVDLFTYSGGWTAPSEELRAANRYLAEMLLALDIPWICAAGNGDNVGGHFSIPYDVASPGDCPSAAHAPGGGATAVLSVGALTATRTVWEGSSRGPTVWDQTGHVPGADYDDYPYPGGLTKPELSAPGDAVTSCAGGGGYVAYSGTSMSCPLVAGAAAVLLGEAPWLSVGQLYGTLDATATDVIAAPAAVGRDNFSGAGMVNIPWALQNLPTARETSIWIANDGELPLVIELAVESATWLEIQAPAAAIAPGDSSRCVILIDPSALAEGFHQTTVSFISNDPQTLHQLPVTLIYGENLSPVDESTPSARSARLTNRPNPFNPRTILQFTNPAAGPVRIAIFDLKGRRVRSLLDEAVAAGPQEVAWDGRDDGGRELASGSYFARLETPDAPPATRKMLLVR